MGLKTAGKKSIGFSNFIVDYVTLAVIVFLIAFAAYALWDSNQIHSAADKSHYEIYKPAAVDGGKSFKELQALNEEVFAWLTIYGTYIDYPVTQGPDNMKYINTNAEGLYSLSGAIFLDYNNSKHFSDFNSILYGHHMAKKKMFGEIGNFSDKAIFDSHKYGNLYFDEKDHGLEFFAFVHADAYDSSIFSANVGEDARQKYLDNLLGKAVYTRDIGVGAGDHIVLLSTCSSGSTNGRDILAARITDETFEEPVWNAEAGSGADDTQDLNCQVEEIPLTILLTLLLISILSALLIIRIFAVYLKQNKNKIKSG